MREEIWTSTLAAGLIHFPTTPHPELSPPPLIVAGDGTLEFLTPRSGLEPPGPYCRWQDHYPPAAIQDQVRAVADRIGGPVPWAVLRSWSIAWDDAGPLLVLRGLRERNLVQGVGIQVGGNNLHAPLAPMQTGLVDVVVAPMSLFDQRAAAALLPTAADTDVKIVVTGLIESLDEAVVTTTLRRHHLDQRLAPAAAALAFVRSFAAVASVIVPAGQKDLRTTDDPAIQLPPALIADFKQLHRSSF